MPTLLDVPVTLHARGAADPDVVWGRYTDLSAWSSWSPQIWSVTAESRRLAPGLTGTVHGPAGLPVRFEVGDVDELERTWAWRAWVGPVSLHLHHAVTPRGAGSSTSLRMRGPAPVVLAYAPLAQLALARLVRP